MNKSSGVTYIKASDGHKTEHLAKLEQIKALAIRDLTDMLHSMFDGIDDSFFELANNARTNNDQNQYFEAMRDIRIQRKNIENTFKSGIASSFTTLSVSTETTSKTTINHPFSNFESLSLVQNDDLEEDVAITSMAKKAQANFQGPLLQFNTRIAKLYNTQDFNNFKPPLDPLSMCKSFADACSNLEIELKERLIVYKQFDRYVLSNLGTVLEEVNELLIRFGLKPDIKTSGIRQKHTQKSRSGLNSEHEKHANKAHDELSHSTEKKLEAENLLPQLQSLLANIRTSQNTTSTTSSPASISGHAQNAAPKSQLIETQDLISLLTAIQNIPGPEKTDSNANMQAEVIDFHSELKNVFKQRANNSEKQPTLKQIDEDVINLVSMLFEFILEDYNLAAPIQVLISRLQIPILKVVIKDNTFFSSNKHPSRCLLNSLAKAGIGWSAPKANTNKQDNTNIQLGQQPLPKQYDNLGNDPLYNKIYDIVHRILNEFDGDLAIFKELNIEFELFIKKEERKSKIVEQRTKEAEMGQIKSKQAQKIVEQTLNSLLSNNTYLIPELIKDTLKKGWSRAMFLAYLKDEQEHKWQQHCNTAENLIWCLKPLKEQQERQRWIATAPKLLKELKSGLEEVSYNTSGLDETIARIRTELTNSFKNSSFSSVNNQVETIRKNTINNKHIKNKTLIVKQSAVEKQVNSNTDRLAGYIERVNELKIGSWVEFLLLNGNKYRCKLSTFINEADSYIFVNRMGLKTVEKTKIELAQDLSKNQVVFLEQGLMVDRALNALTKNLRLKANV